MKRILLSSLACLTIPPLYATTLPSPLFSDPNRCNIKRVAPHRDMMAIATEDDEAYLAHSPNLVVVKGYLRSNNKNLVVSEDIANICFKYLEFPALGSYKIRERYGSDLGEIISFRFSPNGSMLLIIARKKFMLVDIKKRGRVKVDCKGSIHKGVFNSNTTLLSILATSQKRKEVYIWNLSKIFQKQNLLKPDFTIPRVQNMCWASLDTLAVVEKNKQIQLYKKPFKLLLKELFVHKTPVTRLVGSSHGMFAAFDESLTLMVWNGEYTNIGKYKCNTDEDEYKDEVMDINIYEKMILVRTMDRVFVWNKKEQKVVFAYKEEELTPDHACIIRNGVWYMNLEGELVKMPIASTEKNKKIMMTLDEDAGLGVDHTLGILLYRRKNKVYALSTT